MILRELSNKEFETFKNNFYPSSLYQSIEYKNVMENQGFDTLLVGLVEEDNILAASLILTQKHSKLKYAYAPRGFLIDYNNINLLKIFTIELKRYLSKKNIVAVKLCPMIIKSTKDTKYNIVSYSNYYDNIFYNLTNLGYKHLGYNNYFEALKPRYEAIIDLNVPYYILFKNIRKEFRTKIRSAENKGINIYKGDINDLDILYSQIKNKYPRDLKYFKEMYKEFDDKIELFYSKLDTHHFLEISQTLYQKQEEKCNEMNHLLTQNINNSKIINKKMEADKLLDRYKKQLIKATKLLRDYPEGIITSTALVIKNQDEVYLLMDGYNLKYKNFNSKHLLLWKLCENYAKQGFKKFNLGGITNTDLTKNPYKGLNEFKLGFNAIATEYIGDLELICNNTLYFMYRNVPIKGILKR